MFPINQAQYSAAITDALFFERSVSVLSKKTGRCVPKILACLHAYVLMTAMCIYWWRRVRKVELVRWWKCREGIMFDPLLVGTTEPTPCGKPLLSNFYG